MTRHTSTQTLCEDNDPLDVLVVMQSQVAPFSFMQVKPIGVLQMLDQVGVTLRGCDHVRGATVCVCYRVCDRVCVTWK